MTAVKENGIVISFLGDITLDGPMLKAAQKEDGTFDFSGSFDELRRMLSDSNLVVANLETVFAGSSSGYNPAAVSYNSPDGFLREVGKLNDRLLLTTANNHSLDMGVPGVRRTIEKLDEAGIAHTGSFSTESQKRYLVMEIGGIRIAFAAFTACMNNRENGRPHGKEEISHINSLSDFSVRREGVLKRLATKIPGLRGLARNLKVGLLRTAKKPILRPYTDNTEITPDGEAAIEKCIEILREARKESDIVVVCVHSGGQFNEKPGAYTQKLFEKLSPYAEIIIGNHPHVIQQMELKEGRILAYSLGSTNLSSSADYVIPEFNPDFSALLKVRLKKAGEAVDTADASVTLLEANENEDYFVRVLSVKTLYENGTESEREVLRKTISRLSHRITGRENSFVTFGEIPLVDTGKEGNQ